jgi:hypothetical protein
MDPLHAPQINQAFQNHLIHEATKNSNLATYSALLGGYKQKWKALPPGPLYAASAKHDLQQNSS